MHNNRKFRFRHPSNTYVDHFQKSSDIICFNIIKIMFIKEVFISKEEKHQDRIDIVSRHVGAAVLAHVARSSQSDLDAGSLKRMGLIC